MRMLGKQFNLLIIIPEKTLDIEQYIERTMDKYSTLYQVEVPYEAKCGCFLLDENGICINCKGKGTFFSKYNLSAKWMEYNLGNKDFFEGKKEPILFSEYEKFFNQHKYIPDAFLDRLGNWIENKEDFEKTMKNNSGDDKVVCLECFINAEEGSKIK